MFDLYEYKIFKSGIFLAGHHSTMIDNPASPFFLYTTLRITRITKGEADWKIGPRVFHVQAGDIVITDNVRPRAFQNVKKENPCYLDVFAFTPAILQQHPDLYRLFYSASDEFDYVVSHYLSDSQLKSMYTLLDTLSEQFKQSNTAPNYAAISVTGLLTSILAQFLAATEHSDPQVLRKKNDSQHFVGDLIARSLQFINEHIQEEFSVSALAEHVGFSRGYFSEMFKKFTGESPVSFINKCRVNYAVNLLYKGEMNVLDAALASGFGSSSNFYREFTAIYGTSPKQLLKNS
ncbi:MAG: helix-turn-helix transcriptional regulator [Clostridia bacterium]|nr:helix-turn-helix transcriptional regulator [Clostridia bacterium]